MNSDFEKKLLEKGYVDFSLYGKTMTYEKPKNISTMVNIDNRYFHKTDPILKKIEQGESVMNGISWEDRKGEIIFGLMEYGKPSTLVSPRPKIKINRDGVIEDEFSDDSMNVVLSKFSFDEIFEAMFNKDIVLEVDLQLN